MPHPHRNHFLVLTVDRLHPLLIALKYLHTNELIYSRKHYFVYVCDIQVHLSETNLMWE